MLNQYRCPLYNVHNYPHPSALMLGYTDNSKPLHIAIGVGGGFAWLITAYFPNPEKWEIDFKTRKAVSK
ncbi:MAG: DUF4258 domain-containing protein [Defluviitaleaceae bacterium]|nr:DUF4258 domain-containing protein [Defluviitaleaceae bacterium]